MVSRTENSILDCPHGQSRLRGWEQKPFPQRLIKQYQMSPKDPGKEGTQTEMQRDSALSQSLSPGVTGLGYTSLT